MLKKKQGAYVETAFINDNVLSEMVLTWVALTRQLINAQGHIMPAFKIQDTRYFICPVVCTITHI